LAHLTAPLGAAGGEQVEDLAGAVAVFERDRRVTQTAGGLDVAGLVVAGDEHHVVVPRDRCPPAVGPAEVPVVAVRPQIDVPQQSVERVETEVRR
jgi:hypothetical protein